MAGGKRGRGQAVMNRNSQTSAVALFTHLLCGCTFLVVYQPDNELVLDFNSRGTPTAISVEDPPVFRKQTVCQRGSIAGVTGHHAATVIAFPDGELLAAWYSYAGPHELDGSAIYMSRRLPGESAWQTPWMHVDRPAGDANPVLYCEGDNVWFFQAVVPFGWSTARIEMQRSDDRGWNWSAAKVVAGPLGANVRHPPLRVASGRLLLPAYDDLLSRSLFFASPDGGEWTLLSAISTAAPYQCVQPSVVRLEGGRLLAVMRNTGGEWLWVTASADDGLSWSPPQDSGFANPGSSACLLRLATGRLALILNDSPTERRPLSVALSGDEGRTWSAPKRLAEGDSTYSYPAAIQSPDGLIHVLYSRARESIEHVAFNEAWIVAPP